MDEKRKYPDRRKTGIDVSQSNYMGKMPPQAKEVEESVLGAIMLESGALQDVLTLFSPAIFYVHAHQLIAKAILELHDRKVAIDIMTVSEQLRSNGDMETVGGPYYVMELTNRVTSAANIDFHIKIVYEKFQSREIIRIAMELLRDGFEDGIDPFDLVEKAKQQIATIESPLHSLSEPNFANQIKKAIELMASASVGDGDVIGVTTGFPSLDNAINGLMPGKLVIVAARSGMGKSTLALNIAVHVAKQNIPVDYYSLEEDDTDLIMKIISSEMNLHGNNVQRGKVDWKVIGEFQDTYQDKPLGIQDTTRMSLEDICERIRLRKKNKGVGIVIVDYLQLLVVKNLKNNATRENEVSTISRALKATAKDYGVCVIALSQLKRMLDERTDPRPRLSDLRESGAIENDADKIIFIYRPEHHKIWYDANGYSTHGVAFFDIAKNRGGSLSELQMLWTAHLTRFSEVPAGWKAKFEPNAVVTKKSRAKKGTLTPVRDITEPERNDDEAPKDDLPF